MESPAVTFEKDGDIAIITLNRPEVRNALSRELTDGLIEACQRINEDMGIKCAILTGNGKAFCAGGDIKSMHHRQAHFAGNSAEIRRHYLHGVQRIARTMNEIEIPIIAAVNGAAIGAGLDIALMCDLRIASERALFAESFIKLGMVSAAGGSLLLTRAVGAAVAAELTLTGDSFDAQRALQLGVVSQVLPEGELMKHARELAARVTRHGAHAIRLNKRLLRESLTGNLLSVLELAASMQSIAQHTEDHREAVAAAVEKREAKYVGR